MKKTCYMQEKMATSWKCFEDQNILAVSASGAPLYFMSELNQKKIANQQTDIAEQCSGSWMVIVLRLWKSFLC